MWGYPLGLSIFLKHFWLVIYNLKQKTPLSASFLQPFKDKNLSRTVAWWYGSQKEYSTEDQGYTGFLLLYNQLSQIQRLKTAHINYFPVSVEV